MFLSPYHAHFNVPKLEDVTQNYLWSAVGKNSYFIVCLSIWILSCTIRWAQNSSGKQGKCGWKTACTCPNWYSNWGAQQRADFCGSMTVPPVCARLFPSFILSLSSVVCSLNERLGLKNTVLTMEVSCNPVNARKVPIYLWRKSPFHAVQRDKSRVHCLSQLPASLVSIWSVSFTLTGIGSMRKQYLVSGPEQDFITTTSYQSAGKMSCRTCLWGVSVTKGKRNEKAHPHGAFLDSLCAPCWR